MHTTWTMNIYRARTDDMQNEVQLICGWRLSICWNDFVYTLGESFSIHKRWDLEWSVQLLCNEVMNLIDKNAAEKLLRYLAHISVIWYPQIWLIWFHTSWMSHLCTIKLKNNQIDCTHKSKNVPHPLIKQSLTV